METSAATVMVAKAPQPKVKDRRTGEIATDAETGEAWRPSRWPGELR
ncbi:hypothetical protein ACFY20_03765 [Streptomyces sp. NPDC001312]